MPKVEADDLITEEDFMRKDLRRLFLNSAMLILLLIQVVIAIRLWLNKIDGLEGSGIPSNARLATDLGFIAITLILIYIYKRKEKIIS